MPAVQPRVGAYRTSQAASRDFHVACRVLDHPGGSDCARDAARLEGLLETLARSPTGKEMLEEARATGLGFGFDDQSVGMLGYHDPRRNMIYLRDGLPDGVLLATLAHELRHVRQGKMGLKESLVHPPADNVLLARVLEADAEAIACTVAWELNRAGLPQAWEAQTRGIYGDMAKALEAKATASGGSAGPEATRAAFDTWFARATRVRAYDNEVLSMMEQRLRREGAPAKAGKEKVDVVRLMSVGELPDRDNYLLLDGHPGIDTGKYRGAITRKTERRLNSLKRAFTRAAGHPGEGKGPPRPKSRLAASALHAAERRAADKR